MAEILKDDHTGRMESIVLHTGGGRYFDPFGPPTNLDPSRLDREQLPWWIENLKEAEANIRRLRGRLEAILDGSERRCPVCDTAVTGRADQLYCGATCRQRARRAQIPR
jgi:hypothetical protein